MTIFLKTYHGSTAPYPQLQIPKSSEKQKVFSIFGTNLFVHKSDLNWHEAIHSLYLSCMIWIFRGFTVEILMCLIEGCSPRPQQGVLYNIWHMECVTVLKAQKSWNQKHICFQDFWLRIWTTIQSLQYDSIIFKIYPSKSIQSSYIK